MVKARGKGGKFTSPSSADAVITVTTVLDGADQVAMGFDEMSDSAREYQGSLADGNQANISFAVSNRDVGESLEDLNKKQKKTTEEQRDLIIVTQGLTSALNQATGGIYKTIGGLEAAGRIGPKTAAEWQKNARVFEAATGPLEVILSIYTGYIALGPAITAAITSVTTAKTAETVAVRANTAAWLANPYVLVAAILVSMVASMLVMEKLLVGTTKTIDTMTEAVRRLRDAFREVMDFVNPFNNLMGFEEGRISSARERVVDLMGG